jgi:phage major head subunit gpT-like protein
MADASGQKDIRGIDIDKLAKGFADEANIFKRFTTQTKTGAEEIRWYQKTSGFLDTTDTTGMTLSRMNNVASRARPEVAEQSWTRQNSYVKKFFIESPTISEEDIKGSDVDILATNVRDLVRAVQRQVDARIFSVLVEAAAATPSSPSPTNVNTTAAVADE